MAFLGLDSICKTFLHLNSSAHLLTFAVVYCTQRSGIALNRHRFCTFYRTLILKLPNQIVLTVCDQRHQEEECVCCVHINVGESVHTHERVCMYMTVHICTRVFVNSYIWLCAALWCVTECALSVCVHVLANVCILALCMFFKCVGPTVQTEHGSSRQKCEQKAFKAPKFSVWSTPIVDLAEEEVKGQKLCHRMPVSTKPSHQHPCSSGLSWINWNKHPLPFEHIKSKISRRGGGGWGEEWMGTRYVDCQESPFLYMLTLKKINKLKKIPQDIKMGWNI